MNTTVANQIIQGLIKHTVVPTYKLLDKENNVVAQGRSDVISLLQKKLKKQGVFTSMISTLDIVK